MDSCTPHARWAASGLRKRAAQCVSLWRITIPLQKLNASGEFWKKCRQLTLSPLGIQFLTPAVPRMLKDLSGFAPS
jgi:hypothetical protein